jgi:hypothetical protein
MKNLEIKNIDCHAMLAMTKNTQSGRSMIEMLGVLATISAPMLYETASTTTALAPADVNDAQELFGEDIDVGEKVLVCSPRLYTAIRNTKAWLPASEIAAELEITVQKASALLRSIVANGQAASTDVKLPKKGTVKAYTLA